MKKPVSPIGQSARAAANRRRKTDPEYAALEKKYEASMAIADLVILHRTRTGITQEELAKRMGTSVPAISRLESGFHMPSMRTLQKLAEAIGASLKIELTHRK
jgi:ribosome-binding protein aMBF1 (putative translation factor)